MKKKQSIEKTQEHPKNIIENARKKHSSLAILIVKKASKSIKVIPR